MVSMNWFELRALRSTLDGLTVGLGYNGARECHQGVSSLYWMRDFSNALQAAI